jgi:hypothetical protein
MFCIPMKSHLIRILSSSCFLAAFSTLAVADVPQYISVGADDPITPSGIEFANWSAFIEYSPVAAYQGDLCIGASDIYLMSNHIGLGLNSKITMDVPVGGAPGDENVTFLPGGAGRLIFDAQITVIGNSQFNGEVSFAIIPTVGTQPLVTQNQLSAYLPVNGNAVGLTGLTKSQVGLSSVDNTSDANKPVSTATQTALNLKAADNVVVKLTGNQTITGLKTFEELLATTYHSVNPSGSNSTELSPGGVSAYYTPTGSSGYVFYDRIGLSKNSKNVWFEQVTGGGSFELKGSESFGEWDEPLTPNLTVTGTIFANEFAGKGGGLTGLNATQLTSGTLSVARLPSAVVQASATQTLTNKTLVQATLSGATVFGGSSADQQVFVGASGNVGLGVSNPSVKLDVNGDALIREGLTVEGSLNSYYMRTGFLDFGIAGFIEGIPNPSGPEMSIGSAGALSLSGGEIYLNGSTINLVANEIRIGVDGYQPTIKAEARDGLMESQDMWLQPSGAGRLMVTSDSVLMGNVGVGTGSPTAKLDVVGSVRADFITLGRPVGSNNVGFNTSGLNQTTTAEVRAGYNAAPPALAWHYESRASRFIRMEQNGTINVVAPAGENGGQAVLAVNGSPVLTQGSLLSTSGNFGVGSNPGALAANWKGSQVVGLDLFDKVVVGPLVSTYTGATVGAHNSALNAWRDLNLASTNLIFRTNGEVEAARLTASGNFGIGTSEPNTKLEVVTAAAAVVDVLRLVNTTYDPYDNSGLTGAALSFVNDGDRSNSGAKIQQIRRGAYNISDLAFLTNETAAAGDHTAERMRISAIGNVGIGTSTPAAKLDVAGDTKVSGTVTAAKVRVPESGDLSMGDFRTGANPAPVTP